MVKRNVIATKLTKTCTQTQKRAFDVAVTEQLIMYSWSDGHRVPATVAGNKYSHEQIFCPALRCDWLGVVRVFFLPLCPLKKEQTYIQTVLVFYTEHKTKNKNQKITSFR